MVPLAPLAELAAHEQQLLARVRPHEAEEQPQIGELLPAVAGHLVQQRALAVHHLVVGDGQDELFGKGVEQSEGQFVVVMSTMDGVFGDVAQAVVHPAHVPLVGKAQPAFAGRPADPGPGSGLLGDHQRAGHLQVHHVVEVAEEVDGLQVFAAAVAVGNPFAGLSGIVPVEHRGHGVHAQPVNMESAQPVEGRGEHETVHLGASEVVDVGVPVAVKALEGVGVFVQRGAVEAAQAMGVGGVMRRHPVEDHPQPRAVAGVHEGGEILRTAVAGGGGEQAQRLIAPGAAERVLHDRQQLDMAEAQVQHIGDQLFAQFRPAQLPTVPFAVAPPGADVHFIDGQWLVMGLALRALFHPFGIVPGIIQRRGHHRTGGRRRLAGARQRVGLERQQALLAEDLVLVDLPDAEAGNEQFPHARGVAQAHRMATPVPGIEVADHRHPPRIGRPDGEAHAVHLLVPRQLGAEHLAQLTMITLAEQVDVQIAQQRAEGVGVLGFLHAVWPMDAVAVIAGRFDAQTEQPGVGLCHLAQQLAVRRPVARGGAPGCRQQLDTLRAGQPGADEGTVAVAVRAQKGKRIAVFALLQGLDGGTFGGSLHGGGQVVHGCDFSSSGLHRSTNPCSGTSSQSGR